MVETKWRGHVHVRLPFTLPCRALIGETTDEPEITAERKSKQPVLPPVGTKVYITNEHGSAAAWGIVHTANASNNTQYVDMSKVM